jgi:aminoglycoside 3-N-acetyltransferase
MPNSNRIMNSKRTTKEELICQIKSLGLINGDIVFLAADLLNVGYFNNTRDNTYKDWVEILTTCVGEDGTIVLPSYTESFFRFNKDSNIIFDVKNNISSSGALSNAFLNYSTYKRSLHPTNSCIAVGKYADYILQDHDQNATSYLPYQRIIELGGKNLMLGAFSERKLAPMALHAAQEMLGYTKKHWMAGYYQTYYLDVNGNKHLFTRLDPGGCTSGAYKLIGDHIVEGAIKFTMVGNSLSALIDTKKSFEIFVKMLKDNPSLLRCNDRLCNSCYGVELYNPNGYFFHNVKLFFRTITRKVNFF